MRSSDMVPVGVDKKGDIKAGKQNFHFNLKKKRVNNI